MKFQILYYGNDRISKLEGEALMRELTQSLNSNKNIFENFLKIIRNREWFEESQKLMEKNKNPLPYPSSIMMKINNSFDNVIIDLLPKLCYMGIYVNDKKMEKFIEKNFKNLL